MFEVWYDEQLCKNELHSEKKNDTILHFNEGFHDTSTYNIGPSLTKLEWYRTSFLKGFKYGS